MSDKKRRGRGVEANNGHQPTRDEIRERIHGRGQESTVTILDNPEETTRWRVAVVATVFEGWAVLTEADAYRLQAALSDLKGVTGNVFLRREQPVLPTDYTSVESVLADIELAIPKPK